MPITRVHPEFLPDIELEHISESIKVEIVHIDAQPPANPQPGMLWYNPETDDLVYYDSSNNPVSLLNAAPTSVSGIKFRANNNTLEYSADGGQTWTALADRGDGLPTTEDVYYVLTEDYPRPDLQEQGFDPLMVADGANWEFVVNAPWGKRRTYSATVTPDGRIWIMAGWNGSRYYRDVWYSFDGSSWTQATSSASWAGRSGCTSVATRDGRVWLMGGWQPVRNDVWYSYNGSSWTQATSSASWAARTVHSSVVTQDDRIWVIGGYNGSRDYRDVWYSANGSSWTQATSGASWTARRDHTSVVTPDGRIWVIGGYNGSSHYNDVWYSTNGSSWTQAVSNAPWTVRRSHTSVITPDGRMWVIGGGTGESSSSCYEDVWYSYDGSAWTQAASVVSWTKRLLHASVVTPDGRIWVMGGYNDNYLNDVYRTSLVPQTVNAQAIDPAAAPQELYMYRKVAYVSNGRDWQVATNVAPWAARCYHASVVTQDGRIWVLGGLSSSGNLNDVWYSIDGASWTQATAVAPWTARRAHASAVTQDGRIWVMGGYTGSFCNDVWYSTNGSSWTQAVAAASWDARDLHTSVTTGDGRIWLLGGFNNVSAGLRDVWYSLDGVSWTQATSSTPWAGRYGHASAVTEGNRIWILGGCTSGTEFSGTRVNDVWYSTNGSTWTQATSAASWGARDYFAAVVSPDARIWIVGGWTAGGVIYTDVWYSLNGSTWTQATAGASWGKRRSHTAVITPNGVMWLLGGHDGTSYKNDVWYSLTEKVFI